MCIEAKFSGEYLDPKLQVTGDWGKLHAGEV
jgi:hypothetical protein